ncbi:MAG: DUF1080 domain-containing protein, partial [Bryobacterales bacterium]|nr:DUF1080 domain-containing protein [Bryobacterales bacterium]
GPVCPYIRSTKGFGASTSEWQEFGIRLVGRVVTVVLNGVTIIDRQVIEGITAMASDARESQPGPIALQGDHGTIQFRKIVLVPLERP